MSNFNEHSIVSAQELTTNSEQTEKSQNQEEFSQKTDSQVDQKVRIFFEKIYSTIEVDSKSFNSNLKEDGIYYGDLSKNYNPMICKTTFDTQNSIFQIEDNEDLLSSCECQFSFLFSSFKSSVINVKTLNLTQKMSLIDLIKRNREINGIVCPFDELAYFKLVEKEKQKLALNVTKLNFYKINEVHDQLIPVSVSTYLMPFFFDIFQPSLLKTFSEKTLEIVLKLKCKYRPKYFFDNNDLLNGYLQEDILWSCFAIFNYKFSMEFQLGFLNYFFGVRCVLEYLSSHFDADNMKINKLELQSKILFIKKTLEFYAEALILTGFLNNKSLNSFLKNNLSKKLHELIYLEDAINDLKVITNKFKILRLADLCRIRVKLTFKNFSAISIKELKVSETSKEFLLFDKEFNRFYVETKNF